MVVCSMGTRMNDEEHRKLIEAIKEKNAKRQAEKDARARHFP